jgi:hypothetical protein
MDYILPYLKKSISKLTSTGNLHFQFVRAQIQWIKFLMTFKGMKRFQVNLNTVKGLLPDALLTSENPYRSAFSHGLYLVCVLIWCGLAIGLVSTNFVLQALK